VKHGESSNRVSVNEAQQANENSTTCRLGENAGHHTCTLDVTEFKDTFGNKISQEKGSAKDVLGFIESNWIKGHVDGRLGVREYGDGPDVTMSRSTKRLRMKTTSLAASIAPKSSASALDKGTDLCILENQWTGQPW
jgi:hypothetical protein